MQFEYTVAPRHWYSQKGGVGSAYIDPLPGDSDIGVINGVWIPDEARGNGVGDSQHKERLKWMKEQVGFYGAICTVSNHNPAELHILEKNGWEKLKQLEYSSIWFKDLTKE